jgi:hypothetical protein
VDAILKLAYRPFGIVVGVLGGILAGALFKRAWKLAAQEGDPPKATDQDRGWIEVVSAAAVEGAVFGGVKAVIDRGGATGFARLTGVWPGARGDETNE